LHFACHGIVDDTFPLESALVLSVPEAPSPDKENGILQAWEIFEQLRIDADLVALSACDTGRGQTLAGEGMIGLVRAFHYAGARTVLASQWPVGDASTADLMTAFYRRLRDGAPYDEALRAGQLELLASAESAGPDRSHPFYWAAFQLIGDWR